MLYTLDLGAVPRECNVAEDAMDKAKLDLAKKKCEEEEEATEDAIEAHEQLRIPGGWREVSVAHSAYNLCHDVECSRWFVPMLL